MKLKEIGGSPSRFSSFCMFLPRWAAESGWRLLNRVYPANVRDTVIHLTALTPDGVPEHLPPFFRGAIAVRLRNDRDFQHLPCHRLHDADDNSTELGWYDLTESCNSFLLRNGLHANWYLPCVMTKGDGCECPFIAHASREEWESLLKTVRTANMRWLLSQCMLFTLVCDRAWLQISGPLNKGKLESAFPLIFRPVTRNRAAKRKRPEECRAYNGDRLVHPSSPTPPSVQRPRKKIRVMISGEQEQQLSPRIFVHASSPAPSASDPAVTSRALMGPVDQFLMKQPKKIGLVRRNSRGEIESIYSLTLKAETVSMLDMRSFIICAQTLALITSWLKAGKSH